MWSLRTITCAPELVGSLAFREPGKHAKSTCMTAQLHRGHGKSSADCTFMFRTRRALFRKELMSNMLCLLQDVAGHEAPLPPTPDKTKRIL